MSEKPPKQIKGFGRKLLSHRRHFSLSCVAIGKRHKSGKSPPGPTTSDSDAMPKTEKVNSANSNSRIAGPMCPVLDPAMVTTVNFFHGNEFYMARRAKLAWLLLARH